MQNLPLAEVYEREFAYLPWHNLIRRVRDTVLQQAPRSGNVLDLL